jgi:hypothetical protein
MVSLRYEVSHGNEVILGIYSRRLMVDEFSRSHKNPIKNYLNSEAEESGRIHVLPTEALFGNQ